MVSLFYLFLVIVIGDLYVGKTQLWSRWVNDDFDLESTTTISVGFGVRYFKLDDIIVGVQFWDTGQFPNLSDQVFNFSISWTRTLSSSYKAILPWLARDLSSV